MNTDDLRKYAKPTKMRWVHIELLSSADPKATHYRDGALTLCPDGTIVLAGKPYPLGRPIRDNPNGIRIYRPRGSYIAWVEFTPGDRRYYTYETILFLRWRWYQSYLSEKPPLFARLFGRAP